MDNLSTHSNIRLPENNKLATQEPEFFKIWLANQLPNDPQLERWIELEASQIENGKKTVGLFEKFFPLSGKRVLDVGCQWGATSIALSNAGAIVTGIDVNQYLVEGAKIRAKEHGTKATFEVSLAESMPFMDNTFDVVICINVIEHVENHKKTISEIMRVLKKDGHVYLDGPNRFSPGWFKSDPHYQLMGISILPHWLGKFYITKIRSYPTYEVGTFPVASIIKKMFLSYGSEIVASSERVKSSDLEIKPDRFFKNLIIKMGAKGFINRLKFDTEKMFYIVVKKK